MNVVRTFNKYHYMRLWSICVYVFNYPYLLNNFTTEQAIDVAINEMIANKNIKAISVGCKPSLVSSLSFVDVELRNV